MTAATHLSEKQSSLGRTCSMMPAICSQMSVFRTSIINQPVLPKLNAKIGILRCVKKCWSTCLNQARGQILPINPGLYLFVSSVYLNTELLQSEKKKKKYRIPRSPLSPFGIIPPITRYYSPPHPQIPDFRPRKDSYISLAQRKKPHVDPG